MKRLIYVSCGLDERELPEVHAIRLYLAEFNGPSRGRVNRDFRGHLIGNNRGGTNGWVGRNCIFSVATKIK